MTSTSNTTNTSDEGLNIGRPAHRVFLVQRDANGEAQWTELCALWPTKKRPGFSGPVKPNLSVAPLTGRIVVLPATFDAKGAPAKARKSGGQQ